MNPSTIRNAALEITGKIAAAPAGGTHWLNTPAESCYIVGGCVPSIKLVQGEKASTAAIYSGVQSLAHVLGDTPTDGIGWWLKDGTLYIDAVVTTLTDSEEDRECAILCAKELGEKAIGHWQNGAYAGDIMI